MKDIIELVLDYWDEDHNCAISTACGTLEYFGKKHVDNFQHAFIGFEKGLGEGSVCGAVTGIFAAMGNILSDNGLKDEEIRIKLDEFKNKFVERYGSINCSNILKDFKKDGEIDFDDPDRKIKCTNLIKNTTTDAKVIIEVETNPLIPVMRRYEMIG